MLYTDSTRSRMSSFNLPVLFPMLFHFSLHKCLCFLSRHPYDSDSSTSSCPSYDLRLELFARQESSLGPNVPFVKRCFVLGPLRDLVSFFSSIRSCTSDCLWNHRLHQDKGEWRGIKRKRDNSPTGFVLFDPPTVDYS